MKLFKKVSAVVLALAMIAVLIPQMGSVVKAAASGTYVYNISQKDSYFTVSDTLSTNTSAKTADFTGGGYKTGTQTFTFTVADGKYAVVELNMNLRNNDIGSAYWVKQGDVVLGSELIEQYPDLKIVPKKQYDASVDSEHFMLPVICEAGTYTIERDVNINKESVLYQIKVTEYADETEAQGIVDAYVKSITDKPKYTISGKITSEVDLTNGTVSLKGIEAGTSSATVDLTKNEDGTYSYTADNVIEGTYNVSVTSQALVEAKMLVDSAALANITFTLNADKTDADFTVPYKEITNTWDFTNIADWSTCSYQGGSEEVIYKGLTIDAINGKFATSTNRIQTNIGTKVKIPVSGWGTVTCTFANNLDAATTLGDVKGEAKTTITAQYENAQFVELYVGTDNSYLTKIEVVPDETPAVQRLGVSIRQTTDDWGNGIRFGSQLDLTKVDKDTCTSGTLIGLATIVGEDNEMTIQDAGVTCVNVVRATYIDETEKTLDYAAALINIPDSELDTKIVARPYVQVGENIYYGEQTTTTYNDSVEAASLQ